MDMIKVEFEGEKLEEVVNKMLNFLGMINGFQMERPEGQDERSTDSE